MNEIVKQPDYALLEKVLLQGDLSKMTPQERVHHYHLVATSLGINELTKPFEYIMLNNKLTLYATKNCTDQLRNLNNISIEIKQTEIKDGVIIVIAKATTPEGRSDEDIGAVNIIGLKGDAYTNSIMKAYTKAKRRVTLSICGLSFVDETEIETIPNASKINVDITTGEIKGLPPTKQINAPQEKQIIPTPAKPLRPMKLELIIASIEKYKSTFEGKLINKNQLILFNIILNKLVDNNKSKRKDIIKFLFDIETSNNATKGMMDYLIKWTEYKDTDWLPADYVLDEAQLILEYMIKEHLLNENKEVA